MLVLSRDAVLGVLRRPLVAPLTTRVRGIPTEVPLDAGDGLPRACVVSLDNVRPMPMSHLVERISRLDDARMEEVCEALRFATDC